MNPEEVEVFARGLYYLADVDGIDERETALITEFLSESGSALTLDNLGGKFHPLEAAMGLEASYKRRFFMRAAMALVRADGTFSAEERKAMGAFADAFGLSNQEFGEIEQSTGPEALK